MGFGCLALATLLVSLLVSLGHLLWAIFAVSAAVLVEVSVDLPSALQSAGQRPDRRSGGRHPADAAPDREVLAAARASPGHGRLDLVKKTSLKR